jgi:hypothetical protein
VISVDKPTEGGRLIGAAAFQSAFRPPAAFRSCGSSAAPLEIRRIIMAWEHEKSKKPVFLDILRNMLILIATGYAVFLTWNWNWIIALIAAIPIYIVMLNLFGFLMLPLYAFTPENRLKAKALEAFENGDFEKGKTLTDEITKKFNVNVPDESLNKNK